MYPLGLSRLLLLLLPPLLYYDSAVFPSSAEYHVYFIARWERVERERLDELSGVSWTRAAIGHVHAFIALFLPCKAAISDGLHPLID